MGARRSRACAFAIAAVLAAGAASCTDGADDAAPSPTVASTAPGAPPTGADPPAPTAAPATAASSSPSTTEPPPTTTATSLDCPEPDPDAVAWGDGPVATAEPILERDDGLAVRAAVYPGPADTGDPWSQWGQGIVTSDGRFLSAVGDHLGADGNSYVYEYDPATGDLTLVTDVLSIVDHAPGAWGYGKIHAQMVPGACDQVYVSTYWGTRTDLEYGNGYEGDLLLRIDPTTRSTAVLGVPVPGHGTPSMGVAAASGLLYGEATDPTSEPDAGLLFTYDLASGETTVVDDAADHAGFRSLAVDADGRALYTRPEGRVTRYDPSTGESTTLPDPLPGRFIRAVTPPAPDGTIYGVTQDPTVWFAIRADGSIDDLGPAPGYIASLAMEPDGSRIYFVPGAHGDGWRDGTPLMAFDPATGEESVVVELNPLTEEELGLTAGGTYDIVLDATRRRLFVGLNAGPVETRDDTAFGEVVLAEITLPVGATAPPPEPTALDAETVTCATFAEPDGDGDGEPVWEDATEASGLEEALVGMMGHAAAWGDADGDGAPDLAVGTFADRPAEEYAERGADGPSPDRLLVAGGEPGTFVDAGTAFEPGRTSGAVFVDLDLDDDLDLVLARNVNKRGETPTEIWSNDGGVLQREPPRRSGLDRESPGRSIGVLDVDGDDLPDLLILEDRFRGGSSRLYRNLGNLRFQELSEDEWPSGVHGLGLGTADLDGDGIVDVVVGGSNRVFAGTGNGLAEVPDAIAPWETFGDEDDAAGVAIGDVDGDGDPDVVIGQHYNSTVAGDGAVPVRLYRNDSTAGSIVLTDVTDDAGLVGIPTKAPHVALVDLDNDGRPDLLTSGSAADGAEPAVFMNRSEDGGTAFDPPSGLGDDQYWVTAPTADVDGDGRLDVVLVEWYPALPSRLLLNRTRSGHAIEVAVDASLGGGPGTVVAAYEPGSSGDPDALVGRVEISPTQGYGGGVEAVAHLGLGDLTTVDIVVTPAGGAAPITLDDVPADRRLRLPDGC